MHHQQRDFIRPPEAPTEPPLDLQFPAARHKRFFGTFLDALLESRRLEARRILHRHEHLIARTEERIPHEFYSECRSEETRVPRAPAPVSLPRRRPPGETGWLVAIAVAFLIANIVAGTIWLRASANAVPARDRSATASATALFDGRQSRQRPSADLFGDLVEASREPGAFSRHRVPFVQETNRRGELLELKLEELPPASPAAAAPRSE